MIINIIILILHTFQNIFFDYQIYVKPNTFIDGGEMFIPDLSLISPQGANEILLLSNSLYFNGMFDKSDYDAIIYNNKKYNCLKLTSFPKKFDTENVTDYLTLSFRSCLRTTLINIPVNFNCKKYIECITINKEEIDITNYQNISISVIREFERKYTSWSGYMFLIVDVNNSKNCLYTNKNICIIGGGFNNELLITPLFSWLNTNDGTNKNIDIKDFPNNYKFKDSDLDMLNNINYQNILNQLNIFNPASVLYDLLKKTSNITVTNSNIYPIMEALLEHDYISTIEDLSLTSYITTPLIDKIKINLDSFSITFDIKYKYRFLIFSLCISCCVFILIIIYLLCIDNDGIIIVTVILKND